MVRTLQPDVIQTIRAMRECVDSLYSVDADDLDSLDPLELATSLGLADRASCDRRAVELARAATDIDENCEHDRDYCATHNVLRSASIACSLLSALYLLHSNDLMDNTVDFELVVMLVDVLRTLTDRLKKTTL